MTYGFSDYRKGKRPPKGWDVADALEDGWTPQEILDYIRDNAVEFTDEVEVELERIEENDHPGPAKVYDINTGKEIRDDDPDRWTAQFILDAKGPVKNSEANSILALTMHSAMRGVIAHNVFKRQNFLLARPPWESDPDFEPRPVQDTDHGNAGIWLEGPAVNLKPAYSRIHAMFDVVAHRNRFDPLSDYLTSLRWDGKARVSRLLTDYFGTVETPYNTTISTRFLVSAVARAMRPGCKADTMMIIEGPQGLRKSTAVKVLFGEEYYSDGFSAVGSKDAQMEQGGVWGIEVAEMHRLSSADVNNVKHFLTVATDRFRPPYGKSLVSMPRRSIMVGTMNPEGNPYLKDQTGARRFWPVESGAIDIAALQADRDQLWAEAMVMLAAGTPWWVQDDEQLAVEKQQQARTTVDAWTDAIAAATDGKKVVTQSHILGALGIMIKDADYRHTDRIGRVMKKLGWVRDGAAKGGRVQYTRQSW